MSATANMENVQYTGGSDDDSDDGKDILGLNYWSSDEDSDTEVEYQNAKTCTKDNSSETEEEDFSAGDSKASAQRSQSKRRSIHLDSTLTVSKKSRKSRNTSHASKIECVDIQEIKQCLSTKKCNCGDKCLQKLKTFKARAVRAIEKIRLQRFSGNLVSPCKSLFPNTSHPGVKNL